MWPTNCTCMKTIFDNLVIRCEGLVISTSGSSFTTYVLVIVIKNCKIGEYFNNCTCMKSVLDNLVIACEDKVVNASTNSLNKKVV